MLAENSIEEQAAPGADIGQATEDTEKALAEFEHMLGLRLSTDTMLLEVQISPTASRYPIEQRMQSVLQRCAAMGITPMPDEAHLRRVLSKGKEKQWLTIANGVPAVLAVPPVLTICVPSVPPVGKDRFRERAYVSKGDAIIRLTAGVAGIPGHDLKGNSLPVAPLPTKRIPVGTNTMIVEDETETLLVAACDGMVTFDRMQFHIRPMQLVTRQMLLRGGKVTTEESVFIQTHESVIATDLIPSGATIVAGGDIYVPGDVDDSTLISTGGSITVLGCVTGHQTKHCRIQAKTDVILASAIHVDIKCGQDVYIQTQARDTIIVAQRNLFLLTRLRSALYDVHLDVAGVVVPFDAPTAPADVKPNERHTFNVECQIPAELGIWEGTNMVLHPCKIVELSVAAACIVFDDLPAIAAGKIVHLKFVLPGSSPIQILARTLPASQDGKTVAGFRQISHQDELAITTHCLALARLRVATTDLVPSIARED